MSILSEIIRLNKERKTQMNPDGQVFKIKFKAVYQYRNRWVLGTIEGKLDTFARKFTQVGKKKGALAIKNADDVFRIRKATKEFVTLRHFLAHKIATRNKGGMFASSTLIQEEAIYLERLVLKGAKINKMWVDFDSLVL